MPNGVLTTTLGLLGLAAQPPAPRVAYLTGTNAGYFLETGYAGLGHLVAQTGAPFSLATLDGTFAYTGTPSGSAASIDATGTFTADGAGHTTSTLDTTTLGVGDISVVTLGATANSTYTLNNATAGRFQLSPSTVIYAISPSSFVLLDENALTTSPSATLLY